MNKLCDHFPNQATTSTCWCKTPQLAACAACDNFQGWKKNDSVLFSKLLSACESQLSCLTQPMWTSMNRNQEEKRDRKHETANRFRLHVEVAHLRKDETMIMRKTEGRLDGIREFYVMMMGDLAVWAASSLRTDSLLSIQLSCYSCQLAYSVTQLWVHHCGKLGNLFIIFLLSHQKPTMVNIPWTKYAIYSLQHKKQTTFETYHDDDWNWEVSLSRQETQHEIDCTCREKILCFREHSFFS